MHDWLCRQRQNRRCHDSVWQNLFLTDQCRYYSDFSCHNQKLKRLFSWALKVPTFTEIPCISRFVVFSPKNDKRLFNLDGKSRRSRWGLPMAKVVFPPDGKSRFGESFTQKVARQTNDTRFCPYKKYCTWVTYKCGLPYRYGESQPASPWGDCPKTQDCYENIMTNCAAEAIANNNNYRYNK